MKALSKAQLTRKQELVETLEMRAKAVETAIAEYNEAVTEANDFRQEVHDQQEEYHGDRSERWQEGDAGQSYSEWMNEWETDFEEAEEPELEHSENLSQLQDEPAG